MKLICDCPFTKFEVNNPNGDVNFCTIHNMVLGNVNKNSIEEIWNGPAYKEVRRKFLDGKIFEICQRGCPAINGCKDYESMDWYKGLPKESAAYKNAVLNEEEMRSGKVELASKPRWLRFSTSYACNLKCYHCFQRQNRKDGLMLGKGFFEDVKKNLEYAQIVFFYGGEPLIEKDNLDLMEYLGEKKLSARVLLISNGTVLDDRIKAILEKLNYGHIEVSVDSSDPKLYEELRYPAKWADTIEHLKFFSALMKKKGGQFFISLTLNKKNKDELIRYIEFSRSLGATPYFQFVNNVFADESFRKNYEIFSFKEHRDLRKQLLAVKSFLGPADRSLTANSVEYLLPYSHYHLLAAKKLKRLVSGKVTEIKDIFKKTGRDEKVC